MENNKKLRIKLSSSNKKLLAIAEKKLSFYFKFLSLIYTVVKLPVQNKNMVFLRSPHVNKKSKEHFGMTVNSIIFEVNINNPQQVFYFLTLYSNKLTDIRVVVELMEEMKA